MTQLRPAAPAQDVAVGAIRARLGAAPGKGRGVFAALDVKAGEIVVTDACIDLTAADNAALAGTLVDDYVFAHPKSDARGLLVLGLASLANHADDPTVATEFAYDRDLGWFVTLRALRDIPAGDEITRRYACPPWFNVRS